MNHLEAAFRGKNNLWRYVVMIFLLLLASNTIGAIPLLFVYMRSVSGDPGAAAEFARSLDLTAIGADPYTALFSMLFPFAAAVIAFVLLVRPLNNRTFRETVNGTRHIRWGHFLIAFFVWLVILAAYLLIYLKITPDNFTLNNLSSSLFYIAVIAIILIPFQAGFEEIVFRGYLMQGFAAASGNRWLPLVATSILFGLMHSMNPEIKEYGFFTMIPQYILFGMIFGLITLFDDGIEAAMGAHAANNIFLVLMVTHRSSALQTPAMYIQNEVNPWQEFWVLMVSGVLLIAVLKVVFGWKNFSMLFSGIRKPVALTGSDAVD